MDAVVGVVNYRGKILIGKKKESPGKILSGQWHVPGETVKEGENDVDALRRGLREEAQLEIMVGCYLGSQVVGDWKVRWYECSARNNEVHAGDDIDQLKWVSKNRVRYEVSPESAKLWPAEVVDYFSH
jgi:ADP-ribose pyrophosphatase YjhB (NUDIX family)